MGFDIVFPTSIEQSEIPLATICLGAANARFRPGIPALSCDGSSGAGKVVLGEVLSGGRSIRPSPGQRIAVGQQKNIRPLNIHIDPDEVVRRGTADVPG